MNLMIVVAVHHRLTTFFLFFYNKTCGAQIIKKRTKQSILFVNEKEKIRRENIIFFLKD
jgi:hypothetical protein